MDQRFRVFVHKCQQNPTTLLETLQTQLGLCELAAIVQGYDLCFNGETAQKEIEDFVRLHLADPVLDRYWLLRFEETQNPNFKKGAKQKAKQANEAQNFEESAQPLWPE